MSMDLLLAYGWQGIVFLVWIALCVGSFLNVVIYRLPVMLERQWIEQAHEILDLPYTPPDEPFNLSVPRSRCPHCGHQIRWFENIPVLSWLAQRAKCTACSAPISARYPIIELLTMLMTVAVISQFGFTLLGLSIAAFTWLLIAAALIDADTTLLPDEIVLPLLWLGLAVNLTDWGLVSLQDAVIGAIAAYGSLRLTNWAFRKLRGKEGMGYGDFKLLGALGAWLGWQLLPAIILVAAVSGLLYAIGAMLLGRKAGNDDTPAGAIPFGPHLAMAGWVCLMFRDNVADLLIL